MVARNSLYRYITGVYLYTWPFLRKKHQLREKYRPIAAGYGNRLNNYNEKPGDWHALANLFYYAMLAFHISRLT